MFTGASFQILHSITVHFIIGNHPLKTIFYYQYLFSHRVSSLPCEATWKIPFSNMSQQSHNLVAVLFSSFHSQRFFITILNDLEAVSHTLILILGRANIKLCNCFRSTCLMQPSKHSLLRIIVIPSAAIIIIHSTNKFLSLKTLKWIERCITKAFTETQENAADHEENQSMQRRQADSESMHCTEGLECSHTMSKF